MSYTFASRSVSSAWLVSVADSVLAGLGLNTAVLEAHNLAWKIALVVQGHGSPKILTTYSLERQAVGLELVQMDRQLVELYAGLEQQSMLDFSSEAATDWLSRLHSFQAKNYAVRPT